MFTKAVPASNVSPAAIRLDSAISTVSPAESVTYTLITASLCYRFK